MIWAENFRNGYLISLSLYLNRSNVDTFNFLLNSLFYILFLSLQVSNQWILKTCRQNFKFPGFSDVLFWFLQIQHDELSYILNLEINKKIRLSIDLLWTVWKECRLFFDKAFRNFFFNMFPSRDVTVLIFLDFSFRYDSVHQKY